MEKGIINMINRQIRFWRKFANMSLYTIYKEHLQFFKKCKYGQNINKMKNKMSGKNKNFNCGLAGMTQWLSINL